MPDLIQRSFTSGEIAPALRSRADLIKYTTGLGLCENFFVRPQGGVYSRPGFRFIGEVGNHGGRARLLPFSFNTEQTYVLVFQNLTMRVIRDGVVVESSPGVPFQLATPYTEAQLSQLKFVQSADVMTITHRSHAPMNLSRTAHNVWALAAINYASTVTPPVPVTPVPEGDVAGGGDHDKTYRYVVTTVNADGVESLASTEVSLTTNSLSVTYGLKLDWPDVPGADYYRVYKDPSDNSQVYGWIGNAENSEFVDFNIAPIVSDSPPQDRQPFAGVGNNPGTVGYYQQRQIFANTDTEPQTVYTTQTGNFSSLRTSNPTRADDAVTFTIAAQRVNEIRHIVSLDNLILLTSGGEWRVTEGQDQVLTPATVGVRIQSYNGASDVPPAVINNTVVYVQEKGSRLRDLNYEFTNDGYVGNDLSVMSEHLFENRTVTEMAYADEPYGILWCVRDDGRLLGLTYLREHQVWGWHQHVTDGNVESVTSISEDGRDAVYIVVNRTIGGQTRRYVERIEKRLAVDPADSFCVDSGLSYTGAPITAVTGLSHLEGESVVALADGNVVRDLTVESGGITLPRAASKIHVGLPYLCTIETLDLDQGQPVNTIKNRQVSVSRVDIAVEASRGGWVGPTFNNQGQTISNELEIKPRFDSDGYGAIALKTFTMDLSIEPQWGKSGSIRVQQRDPLPLAILAVIPDVSIGD